jgi:hypothetical protein
MIFDDSSPEEEEGHDDGLFIIMNNLFVIIFNLVCNIDTLVHMV